MFTQFTTVFIFVVIGIAMVPLMMLVGKILRPNEPDEKKTTTYECGEIPIGDSWIQFNLRFYIIGILFLIFDVEVAFMFPIAATFKKWVSQADSQGLLVFVEISIFVLILLVGFAYAWFKGDLEWIKNNKKVS